MTKPWRNPIPVETIFGVGVPPFTAKFRGGPLDRQTRIVNVPVLTYLYQDEESGTLTSYTLVQAADDLAVLQYDLQEGPPAIWRPPAEVMAGINADNLRTRLELRRRLAVRLVLALLGALVFPWGMSAASTWLVATSALLTAACAAIAVRSFLRLVRIQREIAAAARSSPEFSASHL